ncbi:MAG TPA: hypothetical protein VL944_03430 [Candidatus Acidoferrum sp.]|nr:hypothetical protein [Candidatus Acidoferrum sp.]
MSETAAKVVERPSLASKFVAIGGAIGLIGSVFLPLVGISQASIPYAFYGGGQLWVGIVASVILIVSAIALHTTHRGRIHGWSVIALIFSIFGLTSSSYDIMVIGFGLALIGSIMGITHQ